MSASSRREWSREQTEERDGRVPDAEGAATFRLEGTKRFEVLAAVMVVMFFSSMASTIVSTALPNIIADLHGLSLYAWVFTAFILASAVVIPIYGKLSDVFGRKPLYVVAIALYIVGNGLAGFSQNMEMLVAARAISGMGGGGLQALSQITIGDIFTPQERGRWMGLIMTAFGLAAVIGPTVGGWITDSIGWRWVFWVNIPISLLPLAALLYALPSRRRGGLVRIDYLGIAALIVGLVPILLAITWLGESYSWSSSRVVGGFVFGLFVLGLFVWQEFRAEDPIISPAFFRNGIFVTSMIASFCIALGMYGAIMFVPLFVQGVVGTSARDSGIILSPMMIGFIIGSFISGQLVSRWGRYRIQAVAGLAIACFGMFLFSLMTVSTGNTTVVRNMLVLGIGLGSTMPLFTIAVQNAFPHNVLGAVTASRQFFMSLGGAVGVPIMGALLNSGFRDQFVRHLSPPLLTLLKRQGASSIDPNSLVSSEAQSAIHARFAHLGPSGGQMYHQFIFAVRDGLALTMQTMFRLGFGFLLAGLVVSLFLREIPLRRDHGGARGAIEDETAVIVEAPEPGMVSGRGVLEGS